MSTYSKLFQIAQAVFFGLILFSATTAYASEVHVSNIQITSSGSLSWVYDPWLNIATATNQWGQTRLI